MEEFKVLQSAIEMATKEGVYSLQDVSTILGALGKVSNQLASIPLLESENKKALTELGLLQDEAVKELPQTPEPVKKVPVKRAPKKA